jgi:hypothetical protein
MISLTNKAIWDSFRSFLTANAVLVGLIGADLKLRPQPDPLLAKWLAWTGIIVSLTWAAITARNFDYHAYWYAWARKYERAALGSPEHMIQLGEKFSDGQPVTQVSPTQRLGWSSRLFRIGWLAYIPIAAFLIVYGYLLVLAM